MAFILNPVLEQMKLFYEQSKSPKRFSNYLQLLLGGTNEMVRPITSFNPMGNAFVLEKINELINLEAEGIATKVIDDVNQEIETPIDGNIGVVINLADDVGGAWSNIFITNYNSRFNVISLLKRRFCTPHFWTSQTFSKQGIEIVIKSALYRFVYNCQHKKVETLEAHILQENSIQKQIGHKLLRFDAFENKFYKANLKSTDFSLIFNFLYGDKASMSLDFPVFGNPEGILLM